ncbi:hypothetical protein, partial [Flavobacterium psychrophilum]
ASLTYNLKKYLRFVVKKPSILTQVLSQKVGKNQAFLKAILFNLHTLCYTAKKMVNANTKLGYCFKSILSYI